MKNLEELHPQSSQVILRHVKYFSWQYSVLKQKQMMRFHITVDELVERL